METLTKIIIAILIFFLIILITKKIKLRINNPRKAHNFERVMDGGLLL